MSTQQDKRRARLEVQMQEGLDLAEAFGKETVRKVFADLERQLIDRIISYDFNQDEERRADAMDLRAISAFKEKMEVRIKNGIGAREKLKELAQNEQRAADARQRRTRSKRT